MYVLRLYSCGVTLMTLQIVPRQSAILPDYPNASIHQNHSEMTKFTSEKDAGYVRVRDQLWLWVEEAKKARVSNVISESSQMHAVDESASQSIPKQITEFDGPGSQSKTTITQPDRGNAISSSGGPIFMGNISAGRDFTYNNNQ
jgi:protein SERAC1